MSLLHKKVPKILPKIILIYRITEVRNKGKFQQRSTSCSTTLVIQCNNVGEHIFKCRSEWQTIYSTSLLSSNYRHYFHSPLISLPMHCLQNTVSPTQYQNTNNVKRGAPESKASDTLPLRFQTSYDNVLLLVSINLINLPMITPSPMKPLVESLQPFTQDL